MVYVVYVVLKSADWGTGSKAVASFRQHILEFAWSRFMHATVLLRTDRSLPLLFFACISYVHEIEAKLPCETNIVMVILLENARIR